MIKQCNTFSTKLQLDQLIRLTSGSMELFLAKNDLSWDCISNELFSLSYKSTEYEENGIFLGNSQWVEPNSK